MMGYAYLWTVLLNIFMLLGGRGTTPDVWLNVPIFSEYRPQHVILEGKEARLILQLATGDTLKVLQEGESVSIRARQGQVVAKWRRGEAVTDKLIVQGEGKKPVYVRLRGENGELLERGYRGYLQVVVPSKRLMQLHLINQVALEDYVASVVPAEYPFDDVEGAKAQAVATRTYAVYFLYTMGQDVLIPDHVGAQVYQGVERETPLSRRVAKETAGQILVYRGEPIEAVFSSSCGGHSANNEDVWEGPPRPYLRGRVCKYDRISPHQNWTFKVKRTELLQLLSRLTGEKVKGVLFKDKGKDGRYRTVELVLRRGKRTVRGNWFRLAVAARFGERSLRSMLFRVRLRRGYYYFKGHGFGHGVGLCQWGAHGMALKGKKYKDILTHYYRGVKIRKIEDVFKQTKVEELEPVVSIPQRFYQETMRNPGWED